MKTNRLNRILLFLCVNTVFQSPAQQSDPDRNFVVVLRAQAASGDAQSQHLLACALYFGDLGLTRDLSEAAKLFRKAADQHDAAAQFNLGVCYRLGHGVEQSHSEALKWYHKAAEQGDPNAESNLGFCYVRGLGVEKNYGMAAAWFRKAAEQGNAVGQHNLGNSYYMGEGVEKDFAEAVKWFRKAAEQDSSAAQVSLGQCYARGHGVAKDFVEAVKWYRRAAGRDNAMAQSNLGFCYDAGQGVSKDAVEAAKWYRKAAEQNRATAQVNLGLLYAKGSGVARNPIEAYKWWTLAAAQGDEDAKKYLPMLENEMSRDQISEAQQLARNFKPQKAQAEGGNLTEAMLAEITPVFSGTGFLIADDGYFVTSYHLISGGKKVRLLTDARFISAKVMKVDAANDLALLKAEGRFAALPVAASRGVKLGGTVATVGFPNIGLQGFAPKLAKGEIASLSGAGDDARYFQISVPVQPGNSGGALVDERGNVVGVVSAKLSARAALAASGALPENVNYAIKSSYLLSFLESVPEVSAKLKDSNTKEMKFEDVVKAAEQAAVLVLVY